MPGNGHGRSGVDGRSGLQCAVHIVPNAAWQIGQRIQGRSAKGVAAQVVGNGQARQGRDAAVGKADHIRDRPTRLVILPHRRFRGGQDLPQLPGDNVGIDGAAGIGEGRHILKGCGHKTSLLKIAQIRASARSILCAGTAHGPPPFSKSNKKNSPPLALSEKIWFCRGKALIFFGNRAILITSEIVFLRM